MRCDTDQVDVAMMCLFTKVADNILFYSEKLSVKLDILWNCLHFYFSMEIRFEFYVNCLQNLHEMSSLTFMEM